ncbi:TRAP transporter small permease subunit [Marinobacter sp. TBZ242]|uniref:TRAP transporter small permease protein n=1 Tax=Marinobacter azerbaijanicus TaxID=3050455 RepID=A0ABT7IE46_9GAMM|nr:TRAP transporter small permease subunit [Marinobacter sp. TBZ242]MDL0431955.1 TRAP transporter small permease subunit [Marinobacter sp. TBZ242]
MRALTAFMTGVTRLNNLLGRWFSYLVMVMFLLLITGVAFRYLLEAPLSWTGELTQLLFGIYGLMAGGYLLSHNGHVNVDLVYSKFSRRGRAFLDLFTSILFFIFTLALFYFGVDMAWESFSGRETSNSAWNPPIWPVKAFIPAATLLLILQGIVKLLQDIAIAFNLSYYQPEPEPEELPEDHT